MLKTNGNIEKNEGKTDWHTQKMNEILNIKLTERQTEKQNKREKDKVEAKWKIDCKTEWTTYLIADFKK